MRRGPARDAHKEDGPPPQGSVEAARVRFWEDDAHQFHARVDDLEFREVRAVQLFPLSGKAGCVSFLDADGKEMALVVDPDNLDQASAISLRKALERMYYTPRIERVLEITEIMGISKWKVITDRGYAVFEVVDREYIRELTPGRFVISDADGNRFEIPDFAKLDPDSKARVLSET